MSAWNLRVQLSWYPLTQVLDLDKKSHLTSEELKKYMIEEGRVETVALK